MQRTCKVPGCDFKRTSRGLCVKHYYRLGATDAKLREEAEQYANAPNEGRAKGGRNSAPKAARRGRAAGNAVEAPTRHTAEAARIALRQRICELASFAGLTRREQDGNFLFTRSDGAMAVLNTAGELHRATLTLCPIDEAPGSPELAKA